MKYKKGFVTNSSTTVFICDVCNETVAERDIGLSEAGMCECINGHTFCEDHRLVPTVDVRIPDEDDDDYEGENYDLPQEFCPICNLRALPDDEMLAFLMKRALVNEKQLLGLIREQFDSYEAFKKFITEK